MDRNRRRAETCNPYQACSHGTGDDLFGAFTILNDFHSDMFGGHVVAETTLECSRAAYVAADGMEDQPYYTRRALQISAVHLTHRYIGRLNMKIRTGVRAMKPALTSYNCQKWGVCRSFYNCQPDSMFAVNDQELLRKGATKIDPHGGIWRQFVLNRQKGLLGQRTRCGMSVNTALSPVNFLFRKIIFVILERDAVSQDSRPRWFLSARS